VRKEELQARDQARVARGEPAQEEEEKASKIDEQLEELNEELKALQLKPHVTTGHVRGHISRSPHVEALLAADDRPNFRLPQAFVVFKFERDRNRLVKLFRRTRWERVALMIAPYMQPCINLHAEKPPVLSAADNLPVSLKSAPEPSDVFWEACMHPTLAPSHAHPCTL
jgi:hypothetical protein